jgi:hypothetical protein
MEQYFTAQPKDIDGVPQKQYFLVETELGPDPHGPGSRVRLEVMSMLPDEIATLSDTHLFVRQSAGIMPVFRTK